MAFTVQRGTRTTATLAEEVLSQLESIADDLAFSIDDLMDMTTDELFQLLEQYGVRIDREQWTQEIRSSLGGDVDKMNAGGPMDEDRATMLEGRTESALKSAATKVAKSTMRDTRQDIIDEIDDRPDYERLFAWVAVLRNSCRGCESRHGTVLALDAWDEIGRPGDGATPCGDNCECSLVPYDGSREATRGKIPSMRR